MEPTYQYYHTSGKSMGQEMSVQMNTIEFPVGVRDALYFSKSVKGFMNGFFIPGACVGFNSNIKIDGYEYPVTSRRNFAFGAGVAWKKLGMEFRWYSKKDLTGGHHSLFSKYSRFAIILDYRLFETR
jgi:hypothetical protein